MTNFGLQRHIKKASIYYPIGVKFCVRDLQITRIVFVISVKNGGEMAVFLLSL
jgi:hypothetical protein